VIKHQLLDFCRSCQLRKFNWLNMIRPDDPLLLFNCISSPYCITKRCRPSAPRDRAARTSTGSTVVTPTWVLSHTGKNTPYEIRKSLAVSPRPNQKMAIETHAIDGMGRSNWMTGSNRVRIGRTRPVKSPMIIPRPDPTIKPERARFRLAQTSANHIPDWIIPTISLYTQLAGGKRFILSLPKRATSSQMTRKRRIDPTLLNRF